MPFVQGHIRKAYVSAEIETACVHCGQNLHIQMDSDMRFSVHEQQAAPLVFSPDVDWVHFTQPTIIDAY